MKYIIAVIAITFLLVAIYTWREARRMRRMDSSRAFEKLYTDPEVRAALDRMEAEEHRGVHTGSDRHKED